MKVVLVEPGKKARIEEIPGDLRSMQNLVGGYIEAIYPSVEDPVALICNDEGKFNGCEANRVLTAPDLGAYDIVFGTFFICLARPDSEEFESLPDDLAEKYLKKYEYPEVFGRFEGGDSIIFMSYDPEV